MAYIYESVQPGIFNFTIPGENRSVKLLLGSQVSLEQPLSGSYLRVLRFIKEVKAEEIVAPIENKQVAKVEDKITKVEEVAEVKTESVAVEINDELVSNEQIIEPSQNNKSKRK